MAIRSSLGHTFGTENLICECGAMYSAHQDEPHPCPLAVSRYRLAMKPGSTTINALRIATGVPLRVVAEGCGVSEETVRRALNGVTAGKDCTSEKTADRVKQFVRDMGGAVDGQQ